MVSDDRCECNVIKTAPMVISPDWVCVLLWILMGFIAVFIRNWGKNWINLV